MRPRLFTARNFVLLFAAILILSGLAFWIKGGMQLPGASVPSTAGKIVFVSDRGGHQNLWMMNADGSSPVALTDDAPTDSQPTWDGEGKMLAFISQNRAGVNPQVFEMKAAPGSPVAQLTRTSSSKDSPMFGADGRVYFLGSGQLLATAVDATDSDAILPNHTQRKDDAQVFEAGGLAQAESAPTGNHIAAVLRTEREDSLLLYDPAEDQEALSLVGIADRICFSFLPTGSVLAAFNGSPPFQMARPLSSKIIDAAMESQTLTPDQGQAIQMGKDLIANPDTLPENVRPPMDPAQHFLATVATDGSVTPMAKLSFTVDAIKASPDGTMAAISAETGKGTGVDVVALDGSGTIKSIFTQPATHVRWSPDGHQITFVSGGDIYVAAADGSTPPKNLTGGKGHNSDPMWSPAKSAK